MVFDTFFDHHTAFYFMTNPLGALRDGVVIDENNTNYDWNTVWDVKTRRDEMGWTVELVVIGVCSKAGGYIFASSIPPAIVMELALIFRDVSVVLRPSSRTRE